MRFAEFIFRIKLFYGIENVKFDLIQVSIKTNADMKGSLNGAYFASIPRPVSL